MPLPYLRLAGIFALIGIIGLVSWHVHSLNSTIATKTKENIALQVQLQSLTEEYKKATQSAEDLAKAKDKADVERLVVQSERDAALQRLRNQKPPTECKAAIDWAIENKNDLSF